MALRHDGNQSTYAEAILADIAAHTQTAFSTANGSGWTQGHLHKTYPGVGIQAVYTFTTVDVEDSATQSIVVYVLGTLTF